MKLRDLLVEISGPTTSYQLIIGFLRMVLVDIISRKPYAQENR